MTVPCGICGSKTSIITKTNEEKLQVSKIKFLRRIADWSRRDDRSKYMTRTEENKAYRASEK